MKLILSHDVSFIVLNFGHRMRMVGKAWKQEGLLCRNPKDFHGRFAVFLNCKYANNCLASLLTSQLPIDVLFKENYLLIKATSRTYLQQKRFSVALEFLTTTTENIHLLRLQQSALNKKIFNQRNNQLRGGVAGFIRKSNKIHCHFPKNVNKMLSATFYSTLASFEVECLIKHLFSSL